MEKLLEQRMTREMANVETLSQHGSNSRHQVSPRSEELADEAHHNAQGEDHCGGYGHFDEEENLLDQMQGAAPSLPARNITTTPMNDAAPRYAHDTLDQPVAKGTIISTNPKTIVGGQSLGKQFCEVIVNVVIKRDVMLPQPYDNMESVAGAYMMSIAWPYKRLKVVSSKASRSSQGTTGTFCDAFHFVQFMILQNVNTWIYNRIVQYCSFGIQDDMNSYQVTCKLCGAVQ